MISGTLKYFFSGMSMPRKHVSLTAFGKTKTIPAWSAVFGVPEQNIRARLHLGWEPEKAIKTPVGQAGKRLTTAEFIIRSKKVHGSKYRYGKTVYRRNKERVIITCLTHGDFAQLPIHHMAGHGCPACGRQRRQEPVTGS
jgi:hypothetical protein